jgi:tetratricopeptide (TPR) repeat protein
MPLVDRLCCECCEVEGFHQALNAFYAGDIEEALVGIKALLLASPRDPYSLVLAADCFNYYGKSLEALSLVKTAASASAASLDFLLVEVCQLNIMGRFDEGLFCLELASSSWNGKTCWIWQRILQLELMNRCSEAVNYLLFHVDDLKSQHDFYPTAFRLLSGVGQNEIALGLLVEWNTSYPSRDSAKSLADCYFLLNRHDKYVEVLHDVSNLYPDDSNLEVLALQAECDHNTNNIPRVLRLISNIDDDIVKSHEYHFLLVGFSWPSLALKMVGLCMSIVCSWTSMGFMRRFFPN